MNKFLQRVKESIFPPKYPEYSEYRDEDELAAASAALGGSKSVDEVDIKITRLRLIAGFVVIMSIGVGGYLYSHDNDARIRAGLKSPLAAEVLQEALPEEQLQEQNQLNEIQKWAQTMEAEAQRSVLDSVPALGDSSRRSMRSGFGRSSGFGTSPYFTPATGALYEPTLQNTSPYAAATGVGSTSEASAKADSSRPAATPWKTGMSGVSGVTAVAAVAPEPTVPAVADPVTPFTLLPAGSSPDPSSSSSTNQASASDKTDTPVGRYTPRRYDPITIEPRKVEPY